jgi:hypothetical protein
MRKIEFHKVSNIFYNTGIVAFHRYIEKFLLLANKNVGKVKNELLPDKLIIENENVLDLLEEVYYFMGKEIYDTPTKKQKQKSAKYFFVKEPFNYSTFPKMNSFGLAGFITKAPFGPAPTPRVKPRKFKNIYEEDPEFAKNIASVFRNNSKKLKYFEITENGVIPKETQKKGDSNIYLNEPYTKVPRLDFNEKYFKPGNNICSITGESFSKLESSKGTFAFTANVTNFNSFFKTDDRRKISLKAKYACLFSPALAMYSYYNSYDSFTSSFFGSDSLVNINSLYVDEFFQLKDEMEDMKPPFYCNVKFETFKYSKKSGENVKIEPGVGVYSPTEVAFLIIYTFFKKKFQSEIDNENLKMEIDPFKNSPLEKVPISLVTFKADKFASTMRPNFFEEYNNFKFLVRLFYKLESNKSKRIPIRELWFGLLITLPKYKDKKPYHKTRAHAERQIRQSIIAKLLKAKSVLPDMEKLFYKCYTILSTGKHCGYRRYDVLAEFLTIYESTINLGGANMNKSLQQKSINLGKSIGQSILLYDNHERNKDKSKVNAKNGRKYLIGLHKARTISQFREAIIRIQTKFNLSVNNEILKRLDENNFKAIKQYAQISALNQVNSVLSTNKSKDQ